MVTQIWHSSSKLSNTSHLNNSEQINSPSYFSLTRTRCLMPKKGAASLRMYEKADVRAKSRRIICIARVTSLSWTMKKKWPWQTTRLANCATGRPRFTSISRRTSSNVYHIVHWLSFFLIWKKIWRPRLTIWSTWKSAPNLSTLAVALKTTRTRIAWPLESSEAKESFATNVDTHTICSLNKRRCALVSFSACSSSTSSSWW